MGMGGEKMGKKTRPEGAALGRVRVLSEFQ